MPTIDLQTVIRLGSLGLACASAIGLGQFMNHSKIDTARTQWEQRRLLEVVNQPHWQIEELASGVHHLHDAGQSKGFILPVQTNQGYNGNIDLWLALNPAQEILGVRVKSHRETPGLGDKIDIAVSAWITQFDGLSLEDVELKNWEVVRDGGYFDAFTGATVTPRAVVHAVRDGLVSAETQYPGWQQQVEEMKKP